LKLLLIPLRSRLHNGINWIPGDISFMNSGHHQDGLVETEVTPAWTRRELLPFVLFLAGVLLFRLYNLQSYDVISADGTSYAPIGRAFFQSGEFKKFGTISGPVYSFFVGLFDLAVHDLERSLRLVSVVFSTATVGVVYLFARSLFGIRGGIAAALLCAFLPFMHNMSGIDIIEPTFGFFLSVAALCCWNGYQRKSVSQSFLAGLLFGIAYLSRSEGFICWFAMIVFLAIGLLKDVRTAGLKLFGRVLLPFIIGFVLLFAPYMIYLHAETGIWQLSGKSGLNVQVIREYLGKAPSDQKFRLDADGGFDSGKRESLLRLVR